MAALLLALLQIAGGFACGSPSPPAVPPPGPAAAAAPPAASEPAAPDPGATEPPTYDAERRLCVEITNAYRSAIDVPPLAQSPELERYAREAAAHDARVRKAHAFFRQAQEGARVALAENLVPWWPLEHFGSVRAVVERGLEMMWAEGPKGMHYRNLAGRYREVGCGIVVERGEVTVVQAFR